MIDQQRCRQHFWYIGCGDDDQVAFAFISQAELTEGFNAAVDVDHAVQCGFGGLDFPKLQGLKDKINSRQLPPPLLTQLPQCVQQTLSCFSAEICAYLNNPCLI